MALTTDLAKSVATRSKAARLPPTMAEKSWTVLVGEPRSYSSENDSAAFSHSVFCCFTSSNATLATMVKR